MEVHYNVLLISFLHLTSKCFFMKKCKSTSLQSLLLALQVLQIVKGHIIFFMGTLKKNKSNTLGFLFHRNVECMIECPLFIQFCLGELTRH